MKTRIGLFFGSFNPIHMGHMIIAGIMSETTDLKKVWFVVSPQNPFKKSGSLLHEFDRYDMVKAAIADNYKLEVTDVEFHLPRPSYTIDTLTYLSEKHPDKEFVVILGEDNMEEFVRWKNHEKILEYFGLYVYPRPNARPTTSLNHPRVKMVRAPLIDISATFIRGCVRNGQSVRYLVPDPVEALIRIKHHYQ